jgi:hypothetical protein
VASLIKDPEFESLARDHFVVAQVPPAEQATPSDSAALETLLGGAELPADGVELIVTDDGQTPLFTQSGAQSPHRIVTGLRRFLAAMRSEHQLAPKSVINLQISLSSLWTWAGKELGIPHVVRGIARR